MHWRAATLTVLAALAGCGAGAPAPQAPGLRFARCGDDACATLTVPLDHSGRAPGRLRLSVAATRGARPPRGVLVALTGGPGQGGVSFLSSQKARLGAGLRGYRLVMLDQRGTGAHALSCPALQRAAGSSDVTVAPRAAVRSCARRLGARARFFTTTDTVADLEALRRALGARKISLLGVSYGTYVAERYALAHPDRVDRLVLDSVVPHSGVDLLYRVTLRAANRVLPNACGRCLADLRAAIARRPADGPRLLDTLIALSIGGNLRAAAGPLRAAARGDGAPLDRLVASVHRAQAAPAGALSQGLHAATLCGDGIAPWPRGATRAQRLAALARLRRTLPASQTGPYGAATATGHGLVRACLDWPDEPAPPRLARDLPAVPALLLSGGLDLSAPLEWAREERARSPRGRLVVIPDAGHSVQARSARARRAVARFLQSP